MSSDFNDWLQQTFPQMKLEVPLFYNFPLGLRFELGVPSVCISSTVIGF